ncbi:putative non-ribosomal peptide synthase [Burkholderia pseudomallei TSV5]|nr:putative non-ribosomal peptide synthase [Burkholderia pseudomallei]KGS16727.1 putative non-ribosomal peptide synthase [Burkholderia pseudomallei MSHR4378]KGS71636.1 putative non-ribosomal peptide synthase [Burkholderia pseudomallei MSHR4868]KGX66020.1 putative non-ribosomal peptide synthase [Burkholderia pseudomallei TSV5]
MPNELTPARRGCSRPSRSTGRGHAAFAPTTRNGPPSSVMYGLSSSQCRLFASRPFAICSSTLITPDTPAASSRWPMLLFTEPIAHAPGT